MINKSKAVEILKEAGNTTEDAISMAQSFMEIQQWLQFDLDKQLEDDGFKEYRRLLNAKRRKDYPNYSNWCNMKGRVVSNNSETRKYYKDIGITIYEPWIHGWKAFLLFNDYMGPKPTPQHSLDRYPDPAGNYEPGNVRWASKVEQRVNQRKKK